MLILLLIGHVVQCIFYLGIFETSPSGARSVQTWPRDVGFKNLASWPCMDAPQYATGAQAFRMRRLGVPRLYRCRCRFWWLLSPLHVADLCANLGETDSGAGAGGRAGDSIRYE